MNTQLGLPQLDFADLLVQVLLLLFEALPPVLVLLVLNTDVNSRMTGILVGVFLPG